MSNKSVRVQLSKEAYDTAKAEAAKAGFTCVGTKVRHDIEQHYLKIARRNAGKRGAA